MVTGEPKAALKSILVVDDDPLVMRAMKSLMSKAGFQPIVCASGAAALSQANTDIAAAVVDIHLPDINGLSLTQQLRQLMSKEAPIIILSGDNSMETIRALSQTGATHFFSKPVNGAALIEHLKEWVI